MSRDIPAVVLAVGVATTLVGRARGQDAEVKTGIQITHTAVGCVVAEKFPSFEAWFEPAEGVREARVSFRPEGGRHWYSVAMERRGESFSAVIPKPKKSLKGLDYYIEVTGEEMSSSRTEEYSPRGEAGPGACEGKRVAAMLGAATVVVRPPADVGEAPMLPAGFSGGCPARC